MKIFKNVFILFLFFMFDVIRTTKGCGILDEDGTLLPDYVLAADITDDHSPGILAHYYPDNDVTGIQLDAAMSSKYLNFSYVNNELLIILTSDYNNWEKDEAPNSEPWLDMYLVYTCTNSSGNRLYVRAHIIEFTNDYAPEFDKPSYEIKLPMPLHKGYFVAGGCTGVPIIITDYDYNEQYQSNIDVTMRGSDDLEMFVVKDPYSNTWSVNITTKATFIIEKEITVVLTAIDEEPSGLCSGLPQLASSATLTIIPDID